MFSSNCWIKSRTESTPDRRHSCPAEIKLVGTCRATLMCRHLFMLTFQCFLVYAVKTHWSNRCCLCLGDTHCLNVHRPTDGNIYSDGANGAWDRLRVSRPLMSLHTRERKRKRKGVRGRDGVRTEGRKDVWAICKEEVKRELDWVVLRCHINHPKQTLPQKQK